MKRSLRAALWAISAVALPVISNLPTTASAAQGKGSQDAQFQVAKKKIPEPYYPLYRIVEKLSRANNLANRTWEVKVTPDYTLNGFADKPDLIVIPKPALDSLSGDIDAMACMVAREVSHQDRKHQAIGPAELAAIKQKIQEEAIAQAQSNENSKRGWGMGLGLVGGILGVNTAGVQNAINNNTDNATAKMIKDKEAELSIRMSETASRIEKEADEDAFIYLTRAGRDPKGCIRYLEVLSRNPQAEANPAKPQIPGRLQAYRDFIDRESPAKYKKEGSANLARFSKPLNFVIVAESGTLKINSGGSSAKQSVDKF